MHAVSPQMMVWDPATLAVQGGTAEQHILTSGFPTVVSPAPYRLPGAVQQMYAAPSIQGQPDAQGLVWIQQPQIVTQEPTMEELDAGAFTVPGQFPVPQPGLIPVMIAPNGQQLLTTQALRQNPLQVAGQQVPGGLIQFAEHGPVIVQPQSDTIQLVNIPHRVPQGIRFLQEQQAGPLSVEKQSINVDRPRLTPRRRTGNAYNNCDTAASWRRVSDERSLGGCNTAIRRRSHSTEGQDISEKNSVSPTPNKRIAPTPFPAIHRFDFWQAPDSRVVRKLVDIIDYYFSDECLSKNGYMLKQLSSNDGEGYISLRRVASLKRVKSQTRDLRTIAYAVRQSTKLEMDDEGTMVRRKRPLPDNIEAPRFIRSVLAINLPKEAPSVEDVTSLFTPYGDLTQVRVLRPGKTLPPYLKDYTAWVPDLGTRVCAVVEFENQDEAQKACREINMQNRGQNSLRVALLKPGARIRRTLYRIYKEDKAEKIGDKSNQACLNPSVKDVATAPSSGRVRCSSESSDGSAHERLLKLTAGSVNNNINNNKSQLNAAYHYDASGSGSDTGSDTDSIGSKPGAYRIPPKHIDSREKSSGADSGYNHSSSDERESLVSPLPKEVGSPARKDGSSSPVLRRTSPIQKKFIDGVPVGVERQPKGPVSDTKGFAAGARPNQS